MTKTRLPPTGFWSYARRDDEFSEDNLTRLRHVVKCEIQLQFGRTDVKLFQDRATIRHGAAWEREILAALGESSFFIPIITPNFIQSEWCSREVEIFLAREKELLKLHPDLPSRSRIFPIDYRKIRDSDAREPAMLAALRKRQWLAFQDLRHEELGAKIVKARISEFAESICDLLLVEVEAAPAPEELMEAAEAEAARKREAQARRQEAGEARKRARESQQRRAAEVEEFSRGTQAGAPSRAALDEPLPVDQQGGGPDHGRRDWTAELRPHLLAIGGTLFVLTALVWITTPGSIRSPPPAAESGNVVVPDLDDAADEMANAVEAATVEAKPASIPILKRIPARRTPSARDPKANEPPARSEPVRPYGVTIQLGAVSSHAFAERMWVALRDRYPHLAPFSHSVVPRVVGGRTLFLLRAQGPGAEDVCRRLENAGEACAVVR